MARILLLDILLFLLPFVVYGLYVYATRRGEEELTWKDAPWAWLFLAGVICMVIGLALLISFSGEPPGGTYHPPRMENGVIKPGRIE
jgi:cytochrome bd-type quinol oxidase subunit 2